ncbi:hypothetical protein N7462_003847 [Penicillium macrosclerotiorum]|uniref:uncharacterized protein n=1 Tax=Penicillium macrosclerotiorum TaxID=303699 RepID=UPI00254968D0|nr:uncharacterized protein N7462_003847 [Penicillium macrosclerotiorum]KAJ5689455.1 hypothetical protein N7462_003847 [Penicillium macrosclerotiorum]
MERFHWSSSGAGLIFLPLTLPNILAVFIGQLADRFGTRIMGPVVCSLATVATISLRFTQDDNTKSHVVLSLLLVIVGFMFIVVDLGAMTEISTATGPTDDEEGSISQGYALYTMSFAGGQLIGPLVGGFVKAHAGWSVMTLVLGAMCGACAILTRFFGAQPSNSESMEGDDE